MVGADATEPYIFLAYASRDRAGALVLADRLEAAGVRAWIDREAIPGGTSWSSEIVEGIAHCATLVILCTPTAMESRNVRQEIQLAWCYERAYVPLLVQKVAFPEQVQYFLESFPSVELLDRPHATWLPDLPHSGGRELLPNPVRPRLPFPAQRGRGWGMHGRRKRARRVGHERERHVLASLRAVVSRDPRKSCGPDGHQSRCAGEQWTCVAARDSNIPCDGSLHGETGSPDARDIARRRGVSFRRNDQLFTMNRSPD